MSKNILIIDDEIDLLDIMQVALGYEDFNVITSPNPADCKKLIRQHKIDLVILDYLLKGINGGDVCYQLKCCPEFEHIPIVIFSAYPTRIKLLVKYKCDAFIPKPFDLSEIVGQINLLLSGSTNRVLTN